MNLLRSVGIRECLRNVVYEIRACFPNIGQYLVVDTYVVIISLKLAFLMRRYLSMLLMKVAVTS